MMKNIEICIVPHSKAEEEFYSDYDKLYKDQLEIIEIDDETQYDLERDKLEYFYLILFKHLLPMSMVDVMMEMENGNSKRMQYYPELKMTLYDGL